MYGFSDKSTAQSKASELEQRYPENRYYVAPHSFSFGGSPLTWGVVRWVTYCPAMLWRHDGFVWF